MVQDMTNLRRIEIAKRIIPVKSISPASGGEGESKREKVLESK